MVFANLLLLVILFCVFEPTYRGHAIPPSRKRLGVFFILIFCLFSFWGTDWFHYFDIFQQQKEYPFSRTSIEPIYVWIIANISNNYIVFRIIVWGTSLLLLIDSVRRLSINRNCFWLVFISTSLVWFSYSRVILAMSLMFWGVSLLFDRVKLLTVGRLILGLFAIGASYYCHKSAIFGIAIIVLSLLSSLLSKRSYIVFIALLPLVVILVKTNITDFMLSSVDEDGSSLESTLAVAQMYMGRNRYIHGPGAMLQQLLEKASFYLTALLCISLQKHKHYTRFPNGIKVFINIVLLIVILSTVFVFDLSINSRTLYTRFLRFCTIPMAIVLAFSWEERLFPKLRRSTFWIGWMSTLYTVTYSFYVSLS